MRPHPSIQQSFRTAILVAMTGILWAGLAMPWGNVSAQEKDGNSDKAESSKSDQESDTAAEDEFAEIKSQFSEELQALGVKFRDAEDQAERDGVIQQRRELEKNSVDSAIAASKNRNNETKNIRDLSWFLSQQVKGEARQVLVAEIKEKYLDSKDAWQFAVALSEVKSPHDEVEDALRFLREKSSIEKVKANAAFGLIGYLENVKKRRVDGRKTKELDAEIESLLNECAEKYANIKSGRSTIGKLASKKLNLLNLKVGKIAPDIQGVDLDDKEFKLTDYRGKVVVIDFWGDW